MGKWIWILMILILIAIGAGIWFWLSGNGLEAVTGGRNLQPPALPE